MDLTSLSAAEFSAITVVSFLISLVIYNALCLLCDHVSAYRINVAINSSALVIMSFIFIRYYNPSFFTDRSGPNTVHENITVCACLGYYTFDTLYYIWHWAKTSKVMLLHHVVTWYGLATCLYLQVSGTEISIIICGTEMTTPFLIAQRFLPKEGKMRRTVCFSIYVIGTALFVACRLIVGTYLMNVYLPDQKAPVIFRLLGFSLYVLGFPFFVSIVRFGVKNFRSEEREIRDVNKKHVANNNHINNNGFVKID